MARAAHTPDRHEPDRLPGATREGRLERPNPENTLFRLSDGTPLGSPSRHPVCGSTRPASSLSIDAAVKYRGLSLAAVISAGSTTSVTPADRCPSAACSTRGLRPGVLFRHPQAAGGVRTDLVRDRPLRRRRRVERRPQLVRARHTQLANDLRRDEHQSLPGRQPVDRLPCRREPTLFQLQMLTDF